MTTRQAIVADAHEMSEETRQAQAAWDTIASGYDEFVTSTHISLANEGLRRVGVSDGTRLLDVAAGSGAVSIPAARLGAHVVAVDLSSEMIGRLNERARQEKLNIVGHVMDGQALDLDDDTFDVAASQFGVMLFPDLPRGLREMARVTRPGGQVLLHVFGPPQKVEFLTFLMPAVRSVVPDFEGLPTDPVPLPFQVADPVRLREEMSRAGLRDISIETVTEKLEFMSGREMWDWVYNSNPVARMLVGHLSADQEGAVRDALDTALSERAAGDGPAILTSPVHIAIGTVPLQSD